ncbi:hypothetical protein HDU79_003251 [Rhizoclosmatium sp. JEL0117]|nr:hypothetical protein HDU79_003251 [Rhizoclosmatium sp. JEL0117]
MTGGKTKSTDEKPKVVGEKLPPLPNAPTPTESKSTKSKPSTTKRKTSIAKEKLEPIRGATPKQITNNVEKKDEEIIELGSGTAINPSQREDDTKLIITTIISLNLGDKANIPCKKEPPKPSIFFDVSQRKLFTIPIKHLQLLIDTIHKDGKYTPLLIDPTGRVDVYFTYAGNGLIVDTKKLLVQCDIQKTITREDAKEEIRKLIVAGLKYGKCMVFVQMNSAFAFRKYFDAAFFPESVLERGGAPFFEKEVYTPCLRAEDYDEFGRFWPNEEYPFKSVVTTLFALEDYEDFLGTQLDLGKFMPIYIEKD